MYYYRDHTVEVELELVRCVLTIEARLGSSVKASSRVIAGMAVHNMSSRVTMDTLVWWW